MGILDWFTRKDGSAITPAACDCPEHVETLLGHRIPTIDDVADEWSVGDLLASGALDVTPIDEGDRWLAGAAQRSGPFHWSLWVGDEARCLYDDDARLGVDDALLAQPGVDLVEWVDREEFYLGAPRRCRSGVLALAVRALSDPGLRQL